MLRTNSASTTPAEKALEAEAEANLCESCYQMIASCGVANVLVCIGRAARLRGADFTHSSRRLYLYHQRASARILAAYDAILTDSERIEQILDEEQSAACR